MTTGTKYFGSSTPVDTQSGPGSILNGYGSKTWEGGDRPPARWVTELTWEPLSRSKKVLVVRDGVKTREVVWQSRLRKKRTRVRSPANPDDDQHPYEMTYSSATDGLITYKLRPEPWEPWYTGTGFNTGYGDFGFQDLWDANDEIALLGKLRNRIQGASFNAGVFVAESREAFDMITSSASRIARALRFVRKGRLKAASDALTQGLPWHDKKRKVVARNWLELQYGWLPLLHDVQDASEYLAEMHGIGRRVRYRARAKKNGAILPTVPYGKVGGTAVTQVQIVAYISQIDEAKLVGLTDPASVAWELLPYSFVLDWFLPVGEYLSSLALSRSLTGTFVKTHFFKGEGFARDLDFTQGISSKKTYVRLTRAVDNSLSVPMPKLNSLAKMFSYKRAANSVALLLNLKRF